MWLGTAQWSKHGMISKKLLNSSIKNTTRKEFDEATLRAII